VIERGSLAVPDPPGEVARAITPRLVLASHWRCGLSVSRRTPGLLGAAVSVPTELGDPLAPKVAGRLETTFVRPGSEVDCCVCVEVPPVALGWAAGTNTVNSPDNVDEVEA
jgi:hypothetical protein